MALETALRDVAPDTWQREHGHVRLGTVSLLAAIDLATGEVTGLVRPRDRSQDFMECLRHLDARYPADVKIPVVLDHRSAHTCREAQAYLATVPHRSDRVFIPKHASWLHIIEGSSPS
ncbi:MAG: transposase [Firmicutes bacterium]|nr:transposase [Bacillota bacterium]